MQRGHQMRLSPRAGVESSLPKMPAPVVLPVQFQGVAGVRLAEGERHGFRGVGNRDRMNVIGHQAPAKNAQVRTERMFPQHGKVADSVRVGEKYVLPVVAALRHLVGNAETRSTGQVNGWEAKRQVLPYCRLSPFVPFVPLLFPLCGARQNILGLIQTNDHDAA